MLAPSIVAVAVASLAARQSISTPYASLPGLASKLCFEHPEDEGSMTGHPSTVGVFTNFKGSIPAYCMALSSGQAVCISVAPGAFTVLVSSNRFFDPIGDAPSVSRKQECRSLPLHSSLKTKKRITLDVWPTRSRSSGGGYSDCGWDISPRGKPPSHMSKRTRVPRVASLQHQVQRCQLVFAQFPSRPLSAWCRDAVTRLPLLAR